MSLLFSEPWYHSIRHYFGTTAPLPILCTHPIMNAMWNYTVLILSTLSLVYLLTVYVRVVWKST